MTAPLTPADCDLRDFQFMPVDIVRLFASEFHALSNDAEWRAGMTLWLKSFHHVPAASLPDDDVQLCRAAEMGRDLRTWRRVKARALHGWVLCDDGRWYHPVVAEKANEAWERKLFQRERSRRANEARWRRDSGDPEPKGRGGTHQGEQSGRPKNGHEVVDKETAKQSLTSPSSILERSQGTGTGTGTGNEAGEPASRRRGSRLLDDWLPDEADLAYAASRGFQPLAIDRMAERFRNYWTSKTGKDAAKLDWHATWRNWVLTEAERQPPLKSVNGAVDWIG
jgi:hypothetical protein